MITFAALGDSTTVGYGDRGPDGSWRGWASLLAESLDARLHNFAASGALSDDIVRSQLPQALAVRPDVAAVLIGSNDTLRDSFDAARLTRHLDHAVAALRAQGAVVLTIRLPDPGRTFGLPGVLARPLARRMRQVNAAADLVAARHATLHFDAARHPATYDRRLWSVDRLHPSERGHRFLAGAYFDLLAERFVMFADRRPDPEPSGAPPTIAAQLWWMATQGTGWIIRRSTDLLPGLLRLAFTEWRTGGSGTLDAPAGRPEVHDVLGGLPDVLAGLPEVLAGLPEVLGGLPEVLGGVTSSGPVRFD